MSTKEMIAMAKLEYYIEGVAKSEEKVAKCKATIERHEKSLAKKLAEVAELGITLENMESKKWKDGGGGSEFYWPICEVESKLSDIKGATKNLKATEATLANWKEKLTVQINQEKFLSDNVPEVIKLFLEEWMENAFDWYVRRYLSYKDKVKKLDLREDLSSKERYEKSNRLKQSVGGLVVSMSTYYKEDEAYAYLMKELEQDKKFKMLDLVYRIKAAVGEITDASGLYIANGTGNLNGIIVGTNGKAKVETIGAGGYNIQCFHYRTLVHKLGGE